MTAGESGSGNATGVAGSEALSEWLRSLAESSALVGVLLPLTGFAVRALAFGLAGFPDAPLLAGRVALPELGWYGFQVSVVAVALFAVPLALAGRDLESAALRHSQRVNRARREALLTDLFVATLAGKDTASLEAELETLYQSSAVGSGTESKRSWSAILIRGLLALLAVLAILFVPNHPTGTILVVGWVGASILLLALGRRLGRLTLPLITPALAVMLVATTIAMAWWERTADVSRYTFVPVTQMSSGFYARLGEFDGMVALASCQASNSGQVTAVPQSAIVGIELAGGGARPALGFASSLFGSGQLRPAAPRPFDCP